MICLFFSFYILTCEAPWIAIYVFKVQYKKKKKLKILFTIIIKTTIYYYWKILILLFPNNNINKNKE